MRLKTPDAPRAVANLFPYGQIVNRPREGVVFDVLPVRSRKEYLRVRAEDVARFLLLPLHERGRLT
jgi:hypothetical protein